MLVKPKTVLSPEFRKWLGDLIESQGFTVNALAMQADVSQSNLNKGLLGDRNLPDEMLEKIAPLLGVECDWLTTRADIDRIGGIDRIRKHAADLLGAPQAAMTTGATGKYPPTSDEAAQIREAQAVGVWTSHLDEPETWDTPADERAWVFERLQQLMAEDGQSATG